MQQRFARPIAVLLSLAAFAVIVGVPAAGGAPIDDKRAEAARIQKQIDANGSRITALEEQYKGAMLAYDQATAGIAEAQRRFDVAQREVDAKRKVLRERAASLYTGASASSGLQSIDVRNVGELARRSKYGSAASEVDSRTIGDLRLAQEVLADQRKMLEAQQADARARKDAAAQMKREMEQANASQQRLLGQVKGELARLVDQERRRKEAAAASAARAAHAARSSRAPARGAVDPGSVGGNYAGVPTSGGVAAVIAYARAQLGKPYRFATRGPDTFDCSGLTSMAWAQAGVSMVAYSGAQYNAFPHVPISALQPGDLVFKGPGGRDHVALYIGGGMQIAATQTGDFVRLQPLSRNLSGAVRPG
jgi:cell wall-associated NlpC family hydrolase